MEDYYQEGVPVSVPFGWESEPGTPKIRYRDSSLPPLTPPPSYHYNSPNSPFRKNPNPNKTNNLLGTVFAKRARKKKNNDSLSTSSSSSSSSPSPSPYSLPSSPMTRASNFRERYEISSPKLSYDSRAWYDEENEYEPDDTFSSIMCFSRCSNASPRGLYSYLMKVFLKNSQSVNQSEL